MQIFYWLLILIIFYVYFGYPALIALLAAVRKPRPLPAVQELPSVSLVIAARNEEKVIAQKLANTLELDYPREKLEVIVASNGSTDRTDEIVQTFGDRGVRLISLAQPGKTPAQNAAVPLVGGEVVVFSDAGAFLERDAIKCLVRHFADPKVGLVNGQLRYSDTGSSQAAKGEGVYWHYEHLLKTREGALDSCLAGTGSLLAFRKALYTPLDPGMNDDLALAVLLRISGYRCLYEPEAIARDRVAQRGQEQFLRKVRIISVGYYAILTLLPSLFKARKFSTIAQLLSHKVLRWLVPLFLLAMLAANLWLLQEPFYRWVLIGQGAFYTLALMGYGLDKFGKKVYVFYIPFYFCLVNAAALVGLVQWIWGIRWVTWEKAESSR